MEGILYLSMPFRTASLASLIVGICIHTEAVLSVGGVHDELSVHVRGVGVINANGCLSPHASAILLTHGLAVVVRISAA